MAVFGRWTLTKDYRGLTTHIGCPTIMEEVSSKCFHPFNGEKSPPISHISVVMRQHHDQCIKIETCVDYEFPNLWPKVKLYVSIATSFE